jgi:hypothetical protein
VSAALKVLIKLKRRCRIISPNYRASPLITVDPTLWIPSVLNNLQTLLANTLFPALLDKFWEYIVTNWN